MARRFASPARNVELVADRRSAAERRVDELILALVIGRTRPMWAGERTAAVMHEILRNSPPLPWEIQWSDDHD
jgi:hypothetical protein